MHVTATISHTDAGAALGAPQWGWTGLQKWAMAAFLGHILEALVPPFSGLLAHSVEGQG